MKNLYVFFDTVSGNYSDVFSSENDLAMIRSAIRSLASVLPEIARDTEVLFVGSLHVGQCCQPLIEPCVPPRVIFSGANPDVDQMREKLMAEASRYASSNGGHSDEE